MGFLAMTNDDPTHYPGNERRRQIRVTDSQLGELARIIGDSRELRDTLRTVASGNTAYLRYKKVTTQR